MMMSATAELAYGLLWKDRTHEARVLLREAIGKEGQRRGIQYATDTVPARNKEAISITAIHLVHLGKTIEVRAEIEGRWVTVITELADGAFSHIVESGGMETAYLDALRAALFAPTA